MCALARRASSAHSSESAATTSTPAARSCATPAHAATKWGGSRMASTTRAMPASRMRRTHGALPLSRSLHGSMLVYSVAPRSRARASSPAAAARASATSSACVLPGSSRLKPPASTVAPSAATTSAPTLYAEATGAHCSARRQAARRCATSAASAPAMRDANFRSETGGPHDGTSRLGGGL